MPTESNVEAWLKADAQPQLPDAGFSRRVVAQLPARRERWADWLVPTAGALVGLTVMFRGAVTWANWAALWSPIENTLTSEAPLITVGAVIAALALFPALDEMAD